VKYELVQTKTYTREVAHLFTRDELSSLLKEAHAQCKANVKRSYHSIGRNRRRNVISRPASEYQSCIKEYINKKIQERLK